MRRGESPALKAVLPNEQSESLEWSEVRAVAATKRCAAGFPDVDLPALRIHLFYDSCKPVLGPTPAVIHAVLTSAAGCATQGGSDDHEGDAVEEIPVRNGGGQRRSAGKARFD